jgi:hypothetical protein
MFDRISPSTTCSTAFLPGHRSAMAGAAPCVMVPRTRDRPAGRGHRHRRPGPPGRCLRHARHRCRHLRGHAGTRSRQGDGARAWNNASASCRPTAADLPFPDGSFDAVTVAFGVRNFEDLERGIREHGSVCCGPAAACFVLEFSQAPTHTPMQTALPLLLPPGDAPDRPVGEQGQRRLHLPARRAWTPSPKARDFLTVLRRCGLRCQSPAEALTFGIATLYTARK